MATLNIGRVRPVYKGEWSNASTYKILDIVRVPVSGSSEYNIYIAVKDVPASVAITNETYWLKLSVQGPKGERGLPGVDGAQGPQGEPGINGTNGTNGRDGIDGQDGVRFDITQSLTAEQKETASTNMGFWAGAIASVFATYELFKAKVESIGGDYLSEIVKQLILENGGTQAEIDAIENGGA